MEFKLVKYSDDFPKGSCDPESVKKAWEILQDECNKAMCKAIDIVMKEDRKNIFYLKDEYETKEK